MGSRNLQRNWRHRLQRLTAHQKWCRAGQGEQVIHGRAVYIQRRKELSMGPSSQDMLPECRVWYNLEEEVEFR